jgi:predicted signal transduction protein with EAL and GGDEF domain
MQTAHDPDAIHERVAQRILAELAAPVCAHGHLLTVTASIGVAKRCPEDDAQAMLRHADIAMYAAKQHGKSRSQRYTSDLAGLLTSPETRVNDLRQAITEASPPCTLKVRRPALLAPGFAADLATILAEAGTPPSDLTLTIPAGQLADDDAVRAVLLDLRAIGIGLALDHTGTQQVRLDLLAALPFSRLVLDPSFFAGGERQAALVAAVINFVHDTGIECVVGEEIGEELAAST